MEFNADTSIIYIEGVIVSDNPTKIKRRKAVKKTAKVVRDTTRCFCSGRGILIPQTSIVTTMLVCRGLERRDVQGAKRNEASEGGFMVGKHCCCWLAQLVPRPSKESRRFTSAHGKCWTNQKDGIRLDNVPWNQRASIVLFWVRNLSVGTECNAWALVNG